MEATIQFNGCENTSVTTICQVSTARIAHTSALSAFRAASLSALSASRAASLSAICASLALLRFLPSASTKSSVLFVEAEAKKRRRARDAQIAQRDAQAEELFKDTYKIFDFFRTCGMQLVGNLNEE